MKTMTIESFLSKFEISLNSFFDKYFLDSPKNIYEACRYALFGGGKRVRPTLCFLSGKFCDLQYSDIIHFACAIEFIHTYSLIHDDLPCMDNDDYRRGKLTVHKKFGEAIALLAGDALLNTAFEILFEGISINADSLKSATLIAKCAGINGMIGGQSSEFSVNNPDFDDYMDISVKKTGNLIYAAVMSPAFLSENNEKISALSSYAKSVGLAFQAADDLIDKNKNEKMSFVTIAGEEKTNNILNDTSEIAHRSLNKFKEEGLELLNYCDKLTKRTY